MEAVEFSRIRWYNFRASASTGKVPLPPLPLSASASTSLLKILRQVMLVPTVKYWRF